MYIVYSGNTEPYDKSIGLKHFSFFCTNVIKVQSLDKDRQFELQKRNVNVD